MTFAGLVQTVIIAFVVQSSGFQQDDYLFFSLGHREGFSVSVLTHSVFGSLIPGFMFVNTLLAQGTPVPRWQLVTITLALYVALIVVLYRLLELLFGPRPGIVLLTSIATCSGLLGVSLVWWTPAINTLPATLLDLLAFDGLARHAVTGKRRYLVLSVLSFAVGIAFYDPSMEVVVPLVLFALLYLSDVFDLRSLWRAFRSRAWLWVGYSVPILLSVAWRETHSSEYTQPPIASFSRIVQFMLGGWTKGFIPSSIGASYTTSNSGPPPWEVLALGQLVFAALVVVTIVRRRSAWRAWLFFLGSFAVTDLVAAIGRASLAPYYQENSIYWLLSDFLLIIALGLAWFPNKLPAAGTVGAGDSDDRHSSSYGGAASRRIRPSHVAAVAIAIALCAAGIRDMGLTPEHSHGSANTSYLSHVESSWQKVSKHRPNTFVWDSTVPWYVLGPTFAPLNTVDTTVALVVPHLRIDMPDGIGYLITSSGSLVRAQSEVISRVQAEAPSAVHPQSDEVCFDGRSGPSTLPLSLTRPVPQGESFMRLQYSGSNGFEITTPYATDPIIIPRGAGAFLVPMTVPKQTSVLRFFVTRNAGGCVSIQVERPAAS